MHLQSLRSALCTPLMLLGALSTPSPRLQTIANYLTCAHQLLPFLPNSGRTQLKQLCFAQRTGEGYQTNARLLNTCNTTQKLSQMTCNSMRKVLTHWSQTIQLFRVVINWWLCRTNGPPPLVRVTVKCPCGRRTSHQAMPQGTSPPPALTCDRECEAQQRRTRLADAFGVTNPEAYTSAQDRPKCAL